MKSQPLSGREFPRFSGVKTFFRLPLVDWKSDYDVAIFGTPYDGGVSYRPGARFAPSHIREYSSLGRGFHWSRAVNIFEKFKIVDVGDCPTVPVDQAKTYERIEKFVGGIANLNRRFISVGGDHSTTLPILRVLKAHYKKPLRLIHFDAHMDSYPAAWDCEYHHGTFVRHAVDEGLIDTSISLQIGLRGPLVNPDDLKFNKKNNLQMLTVDDIRMEGIEKFTAKQKTFGSEPTYISFDIDCLDPAYAPGTGTPVVGGLTTYETQKILRSMKIPNLVGADIVEVSPPYDHSGITALAAVDTLFEILCMM